MARADHTHHCPCQWEYVIMYNIIIISSSISWRRAPMIMVGGGHVPDTMRALQCRYDLMFVYLRATHTPQVVVRFTRFCFLFLLVCFTSVIGSPLARGVSAVMMHLLFDTLLFHGLRVCVGSAHPIAREGACRLVRAITLCCDHCALPRSRMACARGG